MTSSSRSEKRSRAGFTLPEVLVAVAMVGVLSAVVLPNVIGQMQKGEISRVVQDIQSVQQASQMFRSDIGSWPATIQDLVARSAVVPGSPSLNPGADYGKGANQWNGPYLARGDATGGLVTSLGGTIAAFQTQLWDADDPSSAEFVAIVVTGITSEEANRIDSAVDGGDTPNTDVNDPSAGNVRFVTGSPDRLLYLTEPLK